MNFTIRHPSTQSDLSEALAVLHKSFPHVPLEYFKLRYHDAFPKAFHHIYLGAEDEKIVSHVQVFPFSLSWDGKEQSSLGIGGVATLSEKRGAGYAGKVISALLSDGAGCPFFLFTKRPDYYSRFGFRISRRTIQVFSSTDWRCVKFAECSVRALSGEADLVAISQIHAAFRKKLFGVTNRTLTDWGLQQSYFNEDKNLFLVVTHKGSLQGYLRCRRGSGERRNSIRILELGVAEGGDGILDQAVDQVFHLSGVNEVEIPSPLAVYLTYDGPRGYRESLASLMVRDSRDFVWDLPPTGELSFFEADGF